MWAPHHVVAPELQHPAQHIPDDGAAQVAHVHFFGDVRAREVHDDALRRGAAGHRETRRVAPHALEARRNEGVGEAQVDEPRARDFRGLEDALQVEGPQESLRGIPGLEAQGLGQRQGCVALVVSKSRLGGDRDHRVARAVLHAEGLPKCELHAACRPLGDGEPAEVRR